MSLLDLRKGEISHRGFQRIVTADATPRIDYGLFLEVLLFGLALLLAFKFRLTAAYSTTFGVALIAYAGALVIPGEVIGSLLSTFPAFDSRAIDFEGFIEVDSLSWVLVLSLLSSIGPSLSRSVGSMALS